MSVRAERLSIGFLALVGLALLVGPYVYAFRSVAPGYSFGGFLLNPLDGNTYLAKMYEGWRGEWRFTLPYSAGKGNGASIFMFYLSLGHLARAFDWTLMQTFHGARILSAILLYLALYRFLTCILPQRRDRVLAFGLAALGSGMGWLALFFGGFTADFWVAETYPFLSAYTNPHFPLGLALILILFSECLDTRWKLPGWVSGIFAWVLAVVMPFGAALVLAILAGAAILELTLPGQRQRAFQLWRHWFWIALGGAPMLLYSYWAILSDPLFRIWNAQNQTPSPPLWDLLISLSPVLLLSLAGVKSAWESVGGGGRLLLVWTILGIILVYLPWGLQRRFMLGLYVPLCALAALGMQTLFANRRRYDVFIIVLAMLVLPTNLVIILGGVQAVKGNDQNLVIHQQEIEAFEWIRANTDADAVILAAPETSLLIPAHTGRRVIYGHPFETVHAEAEKAIVQAFFRDPNAEATSNLLRRVDFVYFGPREAHFGSRIPTQELMPVYENPTVRIFSVTLD